MNYRYKSAYHYSVLAYKDGFENHNVSSQETLYTATELLQLKQLIGANLKC